MIEYAPPLLALFAAFLFAVGGQFQNLGVQTLDSRTGAAVSITFSALMYWVAAPVFMDWSAWLHPAVLIFAAVGLFRPALSANLSVIGIRYLGPTLASTLASTSPLWGLALGILLLGEFLTLQTGLGTVGIIAGVLLLSRRGATATHTWPVWALLFPLGAAMLRAAAHVLSKVGMEFVPDAYFATLVGFSVSAVLATGARFVKKSDTPFVWNAPGPRWFAFAGLTFGFAVVCLNQALLIGKVVTVVPIIAAAPIFSMILSLVIFRREVLTMRIALAVLIVCGSVALIALNR
ncbi:EamA family transporter [Nisaea acidiphila]|uniref:EamA family transporter n=1 Tax=Nisaea acidiphila TaxID=1862145 RepID=A0A9J7AX84_9PROT|nr:EamA family transporter [Nisaea acidiphila]UUX51041.1 EamA family transporter [Nisaea acidiphila]